MYSEYEILFKHNTKFENKSISVVEYDPSSNKPFMVYFLNKESLEYELYSGEDTLEFAIEVAS